MHSKFAVFGILILLAVNLAACAPASLWPPALVEFLPTVTETVAPSPLPSATPTAPNTPTPTTPNTSTPTTPPTPTRTPPSLSGPYQASFLYAGDSPHMYISEACQYLRDKWTSTHAAPGTVVMVIMFHAIGGETVGDRISDGDFHALMQALYDNGFEAITIVQLTDFMEYNARIPARSVLLVVDDRRNGVYFDIFFRPYQEAYGWPIVNAWISLDDSIGRVALPDNIALENEGWVDHQAHGVIHNLPMGPDSSEVYIYSELQGSIDAFQINFNKTPLAIIWPGGGFAGRPVEVARELGYHLGFTINPRGPLMYNWVPLADAFDPLRPTWLPEGGTNDPLLVLPRYWATDAILHMDEVIQMGQEAAAYAADNQATELDYYNIVCSPAYGQLP